MHITSLTDLSRPSELLQLELSTLNVLIIKPQNNNAIDWLNVAAIGHKLIIRPH